MRLFSDVIAGITDPYLARAALLAQRAAGATAPNPLVGCVIVSDGLIVGEGFHPRAGEPHAEVFALTQAGAAARGAKAYVTLEPCAHHGKTPPCADALIAAGVARVVIGMRDPHALAAGGVEKLRAAGIEVVISENPAPFEALNEGWLKRLVNGLPFLTAKVGVSLDSKPGFERGMRSAMTGPSGAQVTRRLRSACDAILVSAATVMADDPTLTIRNAEGTLAQRQPLRVVLARREIPRPDAAIFCDSAAPTLLLVSDGVDECSLEAIPDNVTIARWPAEGGLAAALRVLGDRGVGELLVETGPRLLTALWELDLIDQLVVVTAGGFAGAEAPAVFVGEADRDGDSLVRRMEAFEAAVVGDVSVSVWRQSKRGT